MGLRNLARIELPAAADMHVHLRQGELLPVTVPQIRKGGVDTVFVMPNLVPPVTTVARALEYKAELQAIDPSVTYLMSLFLHPSITPQVVSKAVAASCIAGVKMYPQGGTTNSDNGVANLEDYYDTFAAMEKHDMVLNLHGEVLEALKGEHATLEEAFLPTLMALHRRFPKLRIVLEHCTTKAAVDAVIACGGTVAATITAHHLYLTTDDAEHDPLAFCKPIPKRPQDRDALLRAVVSGDPKFFFGTDSAPHPLQSKSGDKVSAGVFTQPYATQLVLLALEEAIARDDGVVKDEDVTVEKLARFLSGFGRKFYRLPEPRENIVLERKGEVIPASVKSEDGRIEIGISKAGARIWSLRWK